MTSCSSKAELAVCAYPVWTIGFYALNYTILLLNLSDIEYRILKLFWKGVNRPYPFSKGPVFSLETIKKNETEKRY